jgi:hypothetical protein
VLLNAEVIAMGLLLAHVTIVLAIVRKLAQKPVPAFVNKKIKQIALVFPKAICFYICK